MLDEEWLIAGQCVESSVSRMAVVGRIRGYDDVARAKIASEPSPWCNSDPSSRRYPSHSHLLTVIRMSKAAKKKSSKKRSGSEAAQFDQKTINEFKEAFGIMDQNKDGIIDKNDLKDLYATMGQIASDKQIDDMIKEAPGPINFTVFLTLFGERLTGTDPEATIIGAFAMFDKKETGKLKEEDLLKILQNRRGEPLDEEEIKAMVSHQLRMAKSTTRHSLIS
ncbi:EF hand [Cooperia oncophora]